MFVSISIFSLIQSEKPADFDHMYGHSKSDSIGAMVQGIILMNIYVLLTYNAIQIITFGEFRVSNLGIGLVLLMISFIINLIFSRFLIYNGKKQKSLTLEIQGLNLFQDSIRAILVFVSFILA